MKLAEKYKYILLDLDGTIINPEFAITRSVEYALNHLGIKVENLKDLHPFIGPPLSYSFKEYFGLTDEQVKTAELKYRDRFSEKGIHENELYDGIEDLLVHLNRRYEKLMIATSKQQIFAKQIIDNFGLTSLFTFIGGSEYDGSRGEKAEVIKYVLNSNNIKDLSQVVMIGDRKHDIIGAKSNKIDSIGVLYGYGDYEELSLAGADYIVKNIKELKELLTVNE